MLLLLYMLYVLVNKAFFVPVKKPISSRKFLRAQLHSLTRFIFNLASSLENDVSITYIMSKRIMNCYILMHKMTHAYAQSIKIRSHAASANSIAEKVPG